MYCLKENNDKTKLTKNLLKTDKKSEVRDICFQYKHIWKVSHFAVIILLRISIFIYVFFLF